MPWLRTGIVVVWGHKILRCSLSIFSSENYFIIHTQVSSKHFSYMYGKTVLLKSRYRTQLDLRHPVIELYQSALARWRRLSMQEKQQRIFQCSTNCTVPGRQIARPDINRAHTAHKNKTHTHADDTKIWQRFFMTRVVSNDEVQPYSPSATPFAPKITLSLLRSLLRSFHKSRNVEVADPPGFIDLKRNTNILRR